ncbi:MAG: bifunctional phosphoserine phosphatase/homoserine phosphotransferase ThrH [Desulfobacteraceae bacterium]|nr:bifunctional phosphoserine phosphatase/homoserine phosphotransferase ThrH [Desulfobacteraceae bacterium]MBC2748944.1 bifunctional phosphoserine phosphatase/homoserine phosphotransferase ThrH [Desulfobacteraceae bacterium]
MHIVCSDLEGVFVPEIWINVAQITGIDELRLTTRDISDYNVLMRKRLGLLDQNGLTLRDIQNVIATMEPLKGALEFLDWLRERTRLIIVSDTFVEFADPLIAKLKRPTLFCNSLVVAPDGQITDYTLRQEDGKRKVVEGLQSMNFQVVAMGDSYNDITMLKKAEKGILFRPPENVIAEFPEFPVTDNFDDLKALLQEALAGLEN